MRALVILLSLFSFSSARAVDTSGCSEMQTSPVKEMASVRYHLPLMATLTVAPRANCENNEDGFVTITYSYTWTSDPPPEKQEAFISVADSANSAVKVGKDYSVKPTCLFKNVGGTSGQHLYVCSAVFGVAVGSLRHPIVDVSPHRGEDYDTNGLGANNVFNF